MVPTAIWSALRALFLTITYYVGGKLGLWIAATGGGYAAPVWPPSGIAVAAMIAWGPRYAPSVWLGAFLVNLQVHHDHSLRNYLLAALIASGNTLEALVVAWLLRGYFKISRDFAHLADAGGFIGASALGPLVSATIGISAITIIHPGGTEGHLFQVWSTWWIGDFLGLLVLTPMLIATSPLGTPRQLDSKLLSGLPYPVVLAFVAVVLLNELIPEQSRPAFTGFVVYTGLIWCALALPIRGLFFAVGIFACFSTFRACTGIGFFGTINDPVLRLLLLQYFMGSMAVTTMVLSTLVSERLAARELAHSRELALIASEKMSALGSMTGSIAHEINNPLSVIYNKTALLKEMMDSNPLDVSKASQAVDRIEQTAYRIEKIVRSLRFITRDDGRDDFQDASIKSIIEDTVEICSEQFKTRDVRLIVDPVPEHWQLECRAVQIAQVLLNLLNNAQAAAAPRSERWVQLTTSLQEATVEFSVIDSGPGVPRELHQKIFSPFFTTKNAGEGTGLGLSVSKNIVESHRGSITLDTASLHTRFVVQLPRRQPQAQGQS